jgi:hypothetical protein
VRGKKGDHGASRRRGGDGSFRLCGNVVLSSNLSVSETTRLGKGNIL